MKTSVKILFFIVLFTGIVAFHNRNRENNTFDYHKHTYSIPYAYIEDFGSHPDRQSYDYDLHLTSELKTDLSQKNNIDYINLDLHSNNINELASGTYNFAEPEGKDRKPFTIVGADILIDYNIETGEGNTFYATGGKVIVTKWKEKYVVEFNLELNNGEKINGIYKGVLKNWIGETNEDA